MAPGSSGGLTSGSFQPQPAQALDGSGNAVSGSVTTPVKLFGVGIATATGSIDRATGAYILEWTSQIVGGSFNNFTGLRHLSGTYQGDDLQRQPAALAPSAAPAAPGTSAPAAPGAPAPASGAAPAGQDPAAAQVAPQAAQQSGNPSLAIKSGRPVRRRAGVRDHAAVAVAGLGGDHRDRRRSADQHRPARPSSIRPMMTSPIPRTMKKVTGGAATLLAPILERAYRSPAAACLVAWQGQIISAAEGKPVTVASLSRPGQTITLEGQA